MLNARMLNARITIWLVTLIFTTTSGVFARHALTKTEEGVVAAWLLLHPALRIATARNCDCDEEIRDIREGNGAAWKPLTDVILSAP